MRTGSWPREPGTRLLPNRFLSASVSDKDNVSEHLFLFNYALSDCGAISVEYVAVRAWQP